VPWKPQWYLKVPAFGNVRSTVHAEKLGSAGCV
jgi:hypothetical protein